MTVILTHDHDVGVGQNSAVPVGGFTLVDGAVLGHGVVDHYDVIKHSPAVQWVV